MQWKKVLEILRVLLVLPATRESDAIPNWINYLIAHFWKGRESTVLQHLLGCFSTQFTRQNGVESTVSFRQILKVAKKLTV